MLDRHELARLYELKTIQRDYGISLEVFSSDYVNVFSALNVEAIIHGGKRPSIEQVIEKLLSKYDSDREQKH
ncbi:MAG: hypothetical protein AABX33_03100 [Nanoarchaeota archaeon]